MAYIHIWYTAFCEIDGCPYQRLTREQSKAILKECANVFIDTNVKKKKKSLLKKILPLTSFQVKLKLICILAIRMLIWDCVKWAILSLCSMMIFLFITAWQWLGTALTALPAPSMYSLKSKQLVVINFALLYFNLLSNFVIIPVEIANKYL